MYRVFGLVALTLCVTAIMAMTQTANADLIQQDSSAFSWKYEMTTGGPEADDKDGVTGADWIYNYKSGSAWTTGAFNGTVNGNGTISTYPTSSYWESGYDPNPGQVWSNISYATGFTIEAKVKVEANTGTRLPFAMGGGVNGHYGGLAVGPDSVWFSEDRPPNGTGYQVGVGNTYDNSTDFHVYRLALAPSQDKWYLWRDGDLLANGVASIFTNFPFSYFDFTGTTGPVYGGNTIDYMRLTAGAYAPIPEPSTLVLLCAGLVGLLAYAWRKRK